MSSTIIINNRKIGPGQPTYIIAEMSGNHNHSFEQAVKIIEAAKQAGADAIKIQTYTPDTITIDCNNENFQIKGTTWAGRSLYDLYSEAYTPWEWQPKLKEIADSLNIDFFSTPFDLTAVDFLEGLEVPAYKIASFENVDLPLLETVAQTGKPIIMSTGMATLSEIDEAVSTIRKTSPNKLALLKCTSAYPAQPTEMNLRTIPHLAQTYNLPVGLSDHSLGWHIAIAAVTLGATIVEKHLCLSRNDRGPDSHFSIEPQEFAAMVKSIREVEQSLGTVYYGVNKSEAKSIAFRRSLFAVKDIEAGDLFCQDNVKSIRPGYGLHTRYLEVIIGKKAKKDIPKGTPLSWDLILGE